MTLKLRPTEGGSVSYWNGDGLQSVSRLFLIAWRKKSTTTSKRGSARGYALSIGLPA